MAESVKLGQGTCPVCRSAKARYTLSSKGLCVVTCNGCNFQGFARSERSDELLRDLIPKQADPAPPAPAPGPAPEPAPAPPAPPPPPPPRRGFMSWS